MNCDDRVERLRDLARGAGLDAIVATNGASIAYLTGFRGLQLERLVAAVVHSDGGGALIAPRLDGEAAEAAPTALTKVIYSSASDGMAELSAILGSARRVGIEESHMPYVKAAALSSEGRELALADGHLMALRGRKDQEEIAAIERSCNVVADVMEATLASLRLGDVERDVNAEVELRLRKRGATETHPLVLFGPNSATPHRAPSDRVLTRGEVVVADISACIDGYWGDLTRCAAAGPVTEWLNAAWSVIRDAQQASIEAVRVGVTAGEVDSAQREIVERHPELGACLHGAGHAIGAEIHEPPFLVPGAETTLVEGMVFTIEPGIYQAGTGGIRLEDHVLVTANGSRVLSSLPLELREI